MTTADIALKGVDEHLVDLLRKAGEKWGPLGVALAAAGLTDTDALILALRGEPDEAGSLPDGEYARVEILGHDSHTGWVTESTRAGAPVMVVRDWDGRVLAEIPGHSLYRFMPLATPLKRPEAGPQRAITRGRSDEDESDFDDDEWGGTL